MEEKTKIIIILSVITAVLATVILFRILYIHDLGQAILGEKIFNEIKSPELEVDFLDVGQGDAELIKAPGGQNILIDGGPNARVVERLSDVMPPWDKQIDLMVLTHPHDDHVTGLNEALKRFEVKKILYTGVTHTSPNYLAWLEIVKDKKISIMIIDQPQSIDLGEGAELEILYPLESFLGKAVENLNNASIVVKLIYGQTSFLFTGDAEEPEEKELLEAKGGLAADVLKVGHHGSYTATSVDFLKAVSPRYAIIEVGKDNSFGHPSRRTLKKLERIKAEIFRTDEEGTIIMKSDGENIQLKD